MKKLLLAFLTIYLFASCSERHPHIQDDLVIANGQMPNIAKDNNGDIEMVYGSGDSLLYTYLRYGSNSFSTPELIAVLHDLAASHTRGPQITATVNGPTVIACTGLGNIYSYYKNGSGIWVQSAKINDIDAVAKENLMSLGGNEGNTFAIWLDVRGNGQNKIYGSNSKDGGKTWSKNRMIYTSPDSTVCQCCKPSVVVKGNNIYIMFRNWLNGQRDMYLIQSKDGGITFSKAEKLGTGGWKLNGCPMDGGGLAINEKGAIQTVWRREGKVYSSTPGLKEKEIGEGKGCTIETVKENNIYAWTENGKIVITDTRGKKKLLGEGSLPIVKAIDDKLVICLWEKEKKIHSAIVQL